MVDRTKLQEMTRLLFGHGASFDDQGEQEKIEIMKLVLAQERNDRLELLAYIKVYEDFPANFKSQYSPE